MFGGYSFVRKRAFILALRIEAGQKASGETSAGVPIQHQKIVNHRFHRRPRSAGSSAVTTGEFVRNKMTELGPSTPPLLICGICAICGFEFRDRGCSPGGFCRSALLEDDR